MFLTEEKAQIPKEQLDFAVKKAIDNFNTLDRSKKYVLSFSAGKDSVVMLDIALKYTDLKFDIVYYYDIKDFGPDQEIIEYFEKKYGVKVIQRETFENERSIRNHLYSIQDINALPEKETKKKGMEIDEERLREELHFDYNLIGSRMSDSLTRRMNIKVSGWLQKSKIYPIYHFSEKEVWNYIYTEKIPVNKFYTVDRRSFEKFDYKTLRNLSFGFEKEYKKVLDMFPLVEVLFWVKERKDKGDKDYFVMSDEAKNANLKNYGENVDNYLIVAFDENEKKYKWCEKLGIPKFSYYLDFSDLEAEELAPLERKPLGEVEKITFTDEGGGATTAEKKKIAESNTIENFIILKLKDSATRQKIMQLSGLPENVNALDGSEFA